MGQRLAINMVSCEKVIVNCYYHWGAYSETASGLVRQIIGSLEDTKGKLDDVKLRAILALCSTGAGIAKGSYATVMAEYPDEDRIAYNNGNSYKYINTGLIEATESGIIDNNDCGEFYVWINMDKEEVDFEVVDCGILREPDEICSMYRNLTGYDFDIESLCNAHDDLDESEIASCLFNLCMVVCPGYHDADITKIPFCKFDGFSEMLGKNRFFKNGSNIYMQIV